VDLGGWCRLSPLPLDVISGVGYNKSRFAALSATDNRASVGLPSGGYPLDPHYKESEDAALLKRLKGGERTSEDR